MATRPALRPENQIAHSIFSIALRTSDKVAFFTGKYFIHKQCANSPMLIFWQDKPRRDFTRVLCMNLDLPDAHNLPSFLSDQEMLPMQISGIDPRLTNQRHDRGLICLNGGTNGDDHEYKSDYTGIWFYPWSSHLTGR